MNNSSTPAATKAAAQSRESSGAPVARPGALGECDGLNVYFTLGPGVARAASIAACERRAGDPVYRPLRVYTLDPSALALEGATAVLQVPYEPLRPGPVGSMFQVGDADDDRAAQPLDLDDPKVLITQGLSPSPSNPQFRQQMLYA